VPSLPSPAGVLAPDEPPAGGVLITEVPAWDDVFVGDEECVADALAEAELAGLVVPLGEALVVGFAVALSVPHGALLDADVLLALLAVPLEPPVELAEVVTLVLGLALALVLSLGLGLEVSVGGPVVPPGLTLGVGVLDGLDELDGLAFAASDFVALTLAGLDVAARADTHDGATAALTLATPVPVPPGDTPVPWPSAEPGALWWLVPVIAVWMALPSETIPWRA
jgi:hypothetical protein